MDPAEAEEAANTPTGRVRAGHAKVAGVATVRVKEELRTLMDERGLPSLSRAVGVALEEWVLTRSGRVQNPAGGAGEAPSPSTASIFLRAQELARRVATDELREGVTSGRLYGDEVAPWFAPVLRAELVSRGGSSR